MKNCNATTDQEYWDAIHNKKQKYISRDYKSYKNFIQNKILHLINQNINGERVLEIGAGSSDWLIDLVKNNPKIIATGIDYSKRGCETLESKCAQAGVSINVIIGDIFSPPENMKKSFDLIISFGVVEHFKNLSEAIKAIKEFGKPGGLIFTLIPNMVGINGWLTKKWDKSIYDIHIAHDLNSFLEGHNNLNLDVVWGGYFGSCSFGVLSSCFKKQNGFNYWIYNQLTRISKLLWAFEKYFCELPPTKTFSPYIVIISRVNE